MSESPGTLECVPVDLRTSAYPPHGCAAYTVVRNLALQKACRHRGGRFVPRPNVRTLQVKTVAFPPSSCGSFVQTISNSQGNPRPVFFPEGLFQGPDIGTVFERMSNG